MNASEILTAVNAGEDKDWEFKSAKGGLPGNIWETYSAMANTDGGVIVLGVKEKDGGDFELQGLDDPAKIEKDFWSTINNRGKVSANLLSNSDLPEESLIWLRSVLGEQLGGLNAREVQALVTADVEGSVSNLRLQQFCADHKTDITKMLQDLVARDFLVKDGYGRWASYRLAERLERSGHKEEGTPDITADDSGHKPGSSPHNGGSSPHNGGSSPHKDASSPHSDPQLFAIAEASRKSDRLAPEQTEQIILALCRGRFLTHRQIGLLLNRDPKRTKERFLSKMVKDGRLQAKYPDPTHPDQAYTTKD